MLPRILPRAALLAALFASASHGDPLHALADEAYWHHESNFVFPPKLAEFTRVGAPQEIDGTTTVVAYYETGIGDARTVVNIEIVPVADATPPPAVAATAFVEIIDRAGWRVTIRAPRPDDAAQARLDALIRALPVTRLGTIDMRCPNAGCGT